MEQRQRSPTHSSTTTKYNQNFQLIKTKTHNTKPNPQQQPHFNSYVSDNGSRYDYLSQNKNKQEDIRQKSHSYRVRKSVGSKNTYKSQNGRTVYEIYNIRNKNKNNNDDKSYQQSAVNKYTQNNKNIDHNSNDNNTFSSKSEVIFIDNKNKVLTTDKRITQPQMQLQTNPQRQAYRYQNYNQSSQKSMNQKSNSRYHDVFSINRINIRKNRPLYFQKQWTMNQVIKTENNSQTKAGSIIKQQIIKQTPLNPSKPEDITHILQKTSKILLQKIPEQQPEQPTIQHTIHTSHKRKKVNNNQILCDKQLINRLNLRTKYYRFKHNQKIKQKLEGESYKVNSINNYIANSYSINNFNHQKLCLSKNPSFGKIHQIQFTYTSKVQDIVKALHQNHHNKLVISIKVPKIFHSPPDLFLPLQQLKFKAVMIFQQFGIMRPGLVCENQEIKVMKHPESLTFIYNCQANKVDEQDQILDRYRKSGKFCINWYSDGSVYMGQLENDYRQGLALQWVPGVYVYFGQYEQNYRHGYGVMKYNNKQVYIGVWAYDYYHGYGKLLDEEGNVIKQGIFRNSQIKIEGQYNQLS